MARTASPFPDDLSDVTFATLRGRVTHEQVYERRTGRTSSAAVREMWIRDAEGDEWHFNADAHDAVVRSGHRVHALVAMRGDEAWLLRLRNLSTGDDRTMEDTVRRVGGEAYPVAALLAGVLSLGVMALGGLANIVAALLGLRIGEWVWMAVGALPIAAGLGVGLFLAPGLRRRRALLAARAERFDDLDTAA